MDKYHTIMDNYIKNFFSSSSVLNKEIIIIRKTGEVAYNNEYLLSSAIFVAFRPRSLPLVVHIFRPYFSIVIDQVFFILNLYSLINISCNSK